MGDPFGKEMDGLTETGDKAKEVVVEEEEEVAAASEEETELVEAAAVELEARTEPAGTK